MIRSLREVLSIVVTIVCWSALGSFPAIAKDGPAASASPPPITQAQYDSFLVCAPFLSCHPPTRAAELLVDEWVRRGIVVHFTDNLRNLELRCTREAELPAGLGDLKEIESLTIDGGGRLASLPSDALSALNLESVWLRNFSRLDSLPIEKGVELERLSIEDCHLDGLPGGLENLGRLGRLDLQLEEGLRQPQRLASSPKFLLAALRTNGFPYLECDELLDAPQRTLRDYLVWQMVSQIAADIGSEAKGALVARRIRKTLEMARKRTGKGVRFGCRLSNGSGCDGFEDSLWIHSGGGVVYSSGPTYDQWQMGKEISLSDGMIREGASVSEVEAVMGRPKRKGPGFLYYSVTEGETEIESSTESHLFLFRKGRLWGVLRSSSSVEC